MKFRFLLFLLITAMAASLILTSCSGKKERPDSSAVQTTTSASANTTTTTTQPLPAFAWITADSVWVRSGPGPQFDNIGGASRDQKFAVVGKKGDWYELQFDAQKTGYVSAQYLRF